MFIWLVHSSIDLAKPQHPFHLELRTLDRNPKSSSPRYAHHSQNATICKTLACATEHAPQHDTSRLVVFLAQIIDQIDHLGLAHAGTDGAICFPQNPAREDNPQAVEEEEVEIPALTRQLFGAARSQASVVSFGFTGYGKKLGDMRRPCTGAVRIATERWVGGSTEGQTRPRSECRAR